MIEWLRRRPAPIRMLLYAGAATLAFAMAAGVGATTALMLQDDLSVSGRGEPRPPGEQDDVPQDKGEGVDRSRQEEVAAAKPSEAKEQTNVPSTGQTEVAGQREEARPQQENNDSQQDEVEYASKVSDIQARSVELFLDTHSKMLHYDALTAADVEEMQADQVALKEIAEQVAELRPPQRYREQHEVLRSAVDGMHEAAQLARHLVADPVAATQSDFDEYDRRVGDADARLQRSNEILGRENKTLEGAQEISPS